MVGGFPRLLRILAPLAATLLLVVAIWQAPHTVHHLLEQEVDAQHECLLATSAERSQAAATDIVVVLPVDGADLGVLLAEPPAVPAPPTAPFPARAPPPSTV